jgi:hypothetical protein
MEINDQHPSPDLTVLAKQPPSWVKREQEREGRVSKRRDQESAQAEALTAWRERLTGVINPQRQKLNICLKRVAKICNGKDLLIQMGNTFGENKREAKPLKRAEKRKRVKES